MGILRGTLGIVDPLAIDILRVRRIAGDLGDIGMSCMAISSRFNRVL